MPMDLSSIPVFPAGTAAILSYFISKLIFLAEHQLNVTFTCTKTGITEGYQLGSVMFIINNLGFEQQSLKAKLEIRKWCKSCMLVIKLYQDFLQC